MHFKYILGVDMSKATFNFCLIDQQGLIYWEGQIKNQEHSIEDFIELIKQNLELDHIKDIILCMEYTGIYVKPLLRVWMAQQGPLSLVPACKASQLLAGDKGWDEKSDVLDARRLAQYAWRFPDKLKLWTLRNQTIEQLQVLQRLRTRLIKAATLLKVPAKESQGFDKKQITDLIQKHQENSLIALQKDIKNVENSIKQIIAEDQELKNMFSLVQSVEGVGEKTAIEIIIATQGFTKFSPQQAKQFARYAGVVPLKKQSGSSLNRKARTSKRANKNIKMLLTMGARSLIGTRNELGRYYEKKRAEGKEHLVALNAVRNKIILRIFAVVRKQTIYQKNLNVSLI